MKIDTKPFRVREGTRVHLKQWPTRIPAFYEAKEEYHALLTAHIEKMSARQTLLYADARYSLLLIFQAIDAGGKDGTIKHVMSGLNPQACQVHSFKQPSATELAHDFLWRTTCVLPERGHIGIFNRSYYEEVLVARVHPEIVAAQKLPHATAGPDFWKHRFRSINDLEKHLHRNGTHVIKFFLHISKEEQRRRFLSRIDDPNKNWKLCQADIAERKLWKQYMAAYDDCLTKTTTRRSPWYIIPADDKANSRLVVSQIIMDTLDRLALRFPKTGPAHEKELLAIRRSLTK